MAYDAITPATAHFLTTPGAAAALSRLSAVELAEQALLATLTRLRAEFSADEAGALVALAQLRQQAAVKFPNADRLFFVRDALEQATAWPLAEQRAQQLNQCAPPGPFLDLGCGIGGDTLALARLRPVIAYETDPIRLQFALANARALGLADRIDFRTSSWTDELAAGRLPQAAAAFVDPTRRHDGHRVFRLQSIEPNLTWLLRLRPTVPVLAVKVMPSVQDQELPPGCGVEFVGHDGQCKEAVLWFGGDETRRASVLIDGQWHRLHAAGMAPPIGELRGGMVLHEPHPAVVRAGPFAELCAQLGAHLFDPQIAYLVSAQPATHPLVQSFTIDEVHPFQLKLLNRRLRALSIGQVELKKRGFPVEPEQLRSRLTVVPGGRAATIFFTRRGDERLMLIGRRAV